MKQQEVTQLLGQLGQGDPTALDRLTPIVLDELHRLARHYMSQERAGHTLQATALVNEAYLRLVNMDMEWQNRTHFFAIAARQMRRILVDHARSKATHKRGGKLLRVDFEEALQTTSESLTDLLYLDQLLSELEEFDQRASHLFELRLFSGLGNREIAAVEGISVATVERDIRLARAWIREQLEQN